jgi:hypothetical protein
MNSAFGLAGAVRLRVLKPNSMYNFVEVSGHNLTAQYSINGSIRDTYSDFV